MATILWNTLSILLIIYQICSFIEGLVTTIDITVEGNDVLKSGVRQYSVYGENPQWFTIKCALNTAVRPNEVRLLNKQDSPEALTTNRRIRFTSQWSKKIYPGYSRRSIGPGKYTCMALFSVNSRSAVNGSHSYSTVYSEVEIEYVTRNQLTAFSVGLSVYAGEQVSITCEGYRYANNERCERIPERKSASIINIPYGNNNNDRRRERISYDCGYSYKQCSYYWSYYRAQSCDSYCSLRKCDDSSSDVDIRSQLELFLTPSNFSSNATAMQFNCTSVPPRLMRWTVITANGYILDFNSVNDVIKVSMNVTIKQRPGETILNISEASAGGNEIQMVMCSSYDTTAQVVVTSHRMVINNDSNRDIVPTSTPQTTLSYQHPTTITECNPNPKTDPQQAVAIDSYPEGTEESKEYEKQEQQYQKSDEPTYVNFLVVLIVTLASIVCALTVVVVMLCRRISRTAIHVAPRPRDADADRQEADVLQETVLHDNPIYSSYSETVDTVSSPYDTDQNDSCMYINI